MPKLTDTQLVILSAAADRDNGAVLPLPTSLKAKGGAATTVLKNLIKKGLVAERPASRDDAVWREAGDGQRIALGISKAGLEALGTEPDDRPAPAAGRRRATSKRKGTSAGQGAATERLKPSARPKPGTKQALLIELLGRENGATIAEISKATGWQPHSVRGAISGTLKKKLGLVIASDKVEGRGRVYRIAEHG